MLWCLVLLWKVWESGMNPVQAKERDGPVLELKLDQNSCKCWTVTSKKTRVNDELLIKKRKKKEGNHYLSLEINGLNTKCWETANWALQGIQSPEENLPYLNCSLWSNLKAWPSPSVDLLKLLAMGDGAKSQSSSFALPIWGEPGQCLPACPTLLSLGASHHSPAPTPDVVPLCLTPLVLLPRQH